MRGSPWLFITGILLFAAAVLQQVPLLLVALLFFLASGVARLWARYALEKVEYHRTLSSHRAFFGDTVTLEVGIANRKFLPLPFIRIEDELPEELPLLKGMTVRTFKSKRRSLQNFLSLSWYYRVVRRYPVHCKRRGYFSFGPTTINAGDPFGFFDKTITDERRDYLLIYPRILPLERLGLPSRDPFGDVRSRQRLFEDPMRVMAVREYAVGDPMKRVHWKATARAGRLQSRVYDETTTQDIAVFLDTRTVQPPYAGVVEELLETALITAASVASYAHDAGYRHGLYVNEMERQTGHMLRLPPSEHPEQLLHSLEALAHVQGWPLLALEDVITKEGKSLPWGATLVVITSIPTEPMLATLAHVARAGRRVTLLLIGSEAPTVQLRGVMVRRISEAIYKETVTSIPVAETTEGQSG